HEPVRTPSTTRPCGRAIVQQPPGVTVPARMEQSPTGEDLESQLLLAWIELIVIFAPAIRQPSAHVDHQMRLKSPKAEICLDEVGRSLEPLAVSTQDQLTVHRQRNLTGTHCWQNWVPRLERRQHEPNQIDQQHQSEQDRRNAITRPTKSRADDRTRS